LTVTSAKAYAGDLFTLSVSATSEVPVNGTVSVNVNGKTYTVSLVNGKGTVSVSIPSSGIYSVSAHFNGHDEFNSADADSTANITAKQPITVKGSNVVTKYYQAKNYQVTVIGEDAKALAGVSVKFTVKNSKGKVIKTVTAKTNSKGVAVLPIKLYVSYKPGTYYITADYNGHMVTNKYVVKSNFVSKKKVTTKRKNVNKKHYLGINYKIGKFFKGKKVTLKLNGKKYTKKADSKGKITIKIPLKYVNKLKVGKSYKYTVSFKKDKISRYIKVYKNKFVFQPKRK